MTDGQNRVKHSTAHNRMQTFQAAAARTIMKACPVVHSELRPPPPPHDGLLRYEDIQHRREADREKIAQWTNAIADAENELEMLRARWKQLTDEEKRLNNDNARIWEDLQKARNDLDEETIGRIDFQNQVQTLMEELEFLRRVHEQEVKELQALLAQAPADTREFFKNELALAIRDIKDEYDYIAKQGKQDMESWYKLKVSEVQGSANRAAMESTYQREEVKRMRDNIGDLRGKLGDLENKNALLEKEVQNLNYQLSDDQRQYEMALNDRDATLRRMREECQTLVAELQALLDTKQMLDAEIAIYRKMLEGEESREMSPSPNVILMANSSPLRILIER
ncbi:intermediate filament protein, partial [Teladorsagia circumcincta]